MRRTEKGEHGKYEGAEEIENSFTKLRRQIKRIKVTEDREVKTANKVETIAEERQTEILSTYEQKVQINSHTKITMMINAETDFDLEQQSVLYKKKLHQ